MEKIVIQVNNSNLLKVENLIAHVCYDKHISLYHAIVSIPVLTTINSLLNSYPDSSLLITYNDCPMGISFSITIPQEPSLHYTQRPTHRSPFPQSAFDQIYSLTDEVEVNEVDQTIRLNFYVRGISDIETERRITILQHFHQTTLDKSKNITVPSSITQRE